MERAQVDVKAELEWRRKRKGQHSWQPMTSLVLVLQRWLVLRAGWVELQRLRQHKRQQRGWDAQTSNL